MNHATRILRSLLAAPLLATPSLAQTQWTEAQATGPSARSRPAVAPIASGDHIVLFGGWDGVPFTGQLGDTWLWFGGAWIEWFPTNVPDAVHAAAMAPLDDDIAVLFGGIHGTQARQSTWVWDGLDWTQFATSPLDPRPGPRFMHAMAKMPGGSGALLFGGAYTGGGVGMHDDSWLFSNGVWFELPDGPEVPAARFRHAMAYDARLDRVVMFGGYDSQSELSDTWEFDGVQWVQRFPATIPPARQEHVLAFDAARGRTVLFGGRNDSSRLQDQWEWDGVDWRDVTSGPAPNGRSYAGMAFHELTQELVVFGGQSDAAQQADTWTRTSVHPATSVPLGTGCTSSDGPTELSVAPFAEAWLNDTYQVELTGAPAVAPAVLGFGFSTTDWGSIALPLTLDPLGAPGCTVWSEPALPFAMQPGPGGTRTWSFAIGNATDWVGGSFAVQGFVLDPGASALGLAASNAIVSTVGVR